MLRSRGKLTKGSNYFPMMRLVLPLLLPRHFSVPNDEAVIILSVDMLVLSLDRLLCFCFLYRLFPSSLPSLFLTISLATKCTIILFNLAFTYSSNVIILCDFRNFVQSSQAQTTLINLHKIWIPSLVPTTRTKSTIHHQECQIQESVSHQD